MDTLSDNVLELINDFKCGDDLYWKLRFNEVVREISETEFFTEIIWNIDSCRVCDFLRESEIRLPNKYNSSYHISVSEYKGKPRWYIDCGCFVKQCKIYYAGRDECIYRKKRDLSHSKLKMRTNSKIMRMLRLC
jgi:hypothetical protein